MDYENIVLPLGKNTVIYGHNMKNRSMFHNIRYYMDSSFANTHRYVYLKTLYEYTKWEAFSFYKTDTQFNYIQTRFASMSTFFELAQKMKTKTVYDFGVEIDKNDQILTLSTCTNLADDSRYVLHAKLIEKTTGARASGETGVSGNKPT
ncbi:MAG: class B sortase [Clostridiales bacterium]|jgi:sortase B|nr:class B sortase [Clostridiales bacterium]